MAEGRLGGIVDAVKKVVALVFGGGDKPPASPPGLVTGNVSGGQANVTITINPS